MSIDPTLLEQSLDLAGEGLGHANSAVNLISKLKNLFSAPQPPADADVKLAIAELTDEVANTKIANAELKQKLAAMMLAQETSEKQQAKLARYALFETEKGGLVYRLRDELADGEPTHFCCTSCMDGGRRSILQGGEHSKRCPICKTDFYFRKDDRLTSYNF